jgi:hypothetical protein
MAIYNEGIGERTATFETRLRTSVKLDDEGLDVVIVEKERNDRTHET